ncbi:Serine/threonine-protein kinase plk1 [Mortierella sp. GBA35]|nr:Serine/threonine-protein kinase plk1 [Mortierella sp. GBA35]
MSASLSHPVQVGTSAKSSISTPSVGPPPSPISNVEFRPSATPEKTSIRTPCGSWPQLKPFDSERAPESEQKVEKGIEKRSGKENKDKDQERGPFFDPSTGEVYEKGPYLGKGGYGQVFKAIDTKGGNFAVKAFWPEITKKEINDEISQLGSAGKHQNLIQYFKEIKDPIGRCLLFELCLSKDLNKLLLERGKVTETEARIFGKGIAAGLAHLHYKMSLIHCDIKPENIFFAPGMVIKIGDLGLAEKYDPNRPSRRRVGTPGFIAPEVLRRQAHSYAMDAFSFGVVMYLMLEGAEPVLTWWEKHEIWPENLQPAMEEAEMSSYAKELIDRLLSFDPEERPMLNTMGRQKFFKTGYCPKELDESVFERHPNLVTERKRKKTASEKADKEEARAKLRAKYDHDDPYVDLTTLIYSSDSDNSL